MAEVLRLKKSNCKNCYKCIRHCPVKSIRFSGNQAHIVGDECILCGRCFVVCPQNAKEILDETEKVKVLIGSGAPVIASLAPSFIAAFKGAGIDAMRTALKALGFTDAEETALGATAVKDAYTEMLRSGERSVLISSCCPSVNLLIRKYYPMALPYLADVMTPMEAHAKDIHDRRPDAKVVFIGPCVSKKQEGDDPESGVDAVLTFEELSQWMAKEGVVPEVMADQNPKSLARLFPTTGGILKTMGEAVEGYTYMAIDGVENCMAALDDIQQGKLEHCFIEMSACVGSCVGGPVMQKQSLSVAADYMAVTRYAGEEDFDIDIPGAENIRRLRAPIRMTNNMPTEVEITQILRRMGKTRPEDELNCGSCGYDTCRAKAIAIYQGKANTAMCLPFLKERAENFSDTIINNTPNGILVLNEELEVQQINRAALEIMNIRSATDVLGTPVVRILDPKVFMDVQRSGQSIHDSLVYLPEYKRYVEQTVMFDKEYRIIICLMRDVTEEQATRERKESISRQTVETADRVVEKQMRVVQEIASLLGETAAETKIALTKLKESISDE